MVNYRAKQKTIQPWIQTHIASGTLVYTDRYNIYSRLTEWGYMHQTVNHSNREYTRDEDGDGFHEADVNPLKVYGLCYDLG